MAMPVLKQSVEVGEDGLMNKQQPPVQPMEEGAEEGNAADEEHMEDAHDEEKNEDNNNKTSTNMPKNISPFHMRLLKAQQSPLLTPLHFEVKNLSYWYAMRKKLGPKRHAALITKQNQSNYRWESYIYKMEMRDEDGEIVPKRHFCASHKSKWAAFKNCEKMCRERDANPAEVKDKDGKLPDVDPHALLETHFHMLIVSSKFDRLSEHERLEVVYEALLQECGQQLQGTTPVISKDWSENDERKLQSHNEDPWTRGVGEHPWKKSDRNYFRKSKCGPRENKAGLGLCAPSNNGPYGSLYGQNMCNYEVYRVLLPTQPLTLIIETKTPSQWKPDMYIAPNSERLGRNHMDASGHHIPKEVKPKKQTERMKLLATVIDERHRNNNNSITEAAPGGRSKNLHSKSVSSLLDSLGLDASISGVIDKKKVGGIYGHFFADLPHDIKEKLSKKYRENKTMIEHEGNHNYVEEAAQKKKDEASGKKKKEEDTFQPVTGMSKMRRAMEASKAYADPDVGTQSEAEMMEELYISARRAERAAVRLQRIRRAAILFRSVKTIWKRKYACIHIQRIMRGKLARLYVVLLQRLEPIAVTRIQRLFRHRKTKRIIHKFQALTYRLTRVVRILFYVLPFFSCF
jgi:stress-induced morphogen